MVAPPWVVEQLRQREDDKGLFSGFSEKLFRKGDLVEIIRGPFADHQGTFDGLDANQRIAVLLEIMGRQVKTLVPCEAVRRAS